MGIEGIGNYMNSAHSLNRVPTIQDAMEAGRKAAERHEDNGLDTITKQMDDGKSVQQKIETSGSPVATITQELNSKKNVSANACGGATGSALSRAPSRVKSGGNGLGGIGMCVSACGRVLKIM